MLAKCTLKPFILVNWGKPAILRLLASLVPALACIHVLGLCATSPLSIFLFSTYPHQTLRSSPLLSMMHNSVWVFLLWMLCKATRALIRCMKIWPTVSPVLWSCSLSDCNIWQQSNQILSTLALLVFDVSKHTQTLLWSRTSLQAIKAWLFQQSAANCWQSNT